jgi:transposase
MTIGKSGDEENFALATLMFVTWCRASGIKAFVTLANTIEARREEILNYAASGGASNGFAEALNHLLKTQKCQAHGYRTWEGLRGQML